MKHLQRNRLVQFSFISFFLMALIVIGISWNIAGATGSHELTVRVITAVALGFLLVYVALLALFGRAWKTITEQRAELNRTHGQLAQQIEKLNREVRERQRMQGQLEEAQDAVEAANLAKSAFLANMSREIRTPLSAVIGMTGLLLDMDLSPLHREYVETIRSSSDALLTIINDILDFSRIEAGQLELEEAPFELVLCIEESLDLVAAAAEKGLELLYTVDEDVPDVLLGDVTRLRQVLVNLLNNGVKFTECGEVTVDVSPVERRDATVTLHFAVRDTGIGIPPEWQENLFDSFRQGHTGATRKYGGSGLGLAICKQIVEMMGGRLWLESQKGKGSTFHFTIVVRPHAVTPTGRGAEPLPLANKRVLIVDDNRACRDALTVQIRRWGADTEAMDSAATALVRLTTDDSFDVVVVDGDMPYMNGIELVRESHKPAHHITVPFVLLTRIGQQADDVLELTAAHLIKPIKQAQLLRALVESVGAETPSDRTAAVESEDGQAMVTDLHILLAEDNAVSQKVALRILERLGYRADVAVNGLEVLETLQRQRYDVVLMDIQMPEMDGLEATRILRRELTADRQPYIIAMTANVGKEDRAACFAVGMDDYLGKPVRVKDLEKALQKGAIMKELLAMPAL